MLGVDQDKIDSGKPRHLDDVAAAGASEHSQQKIAAVYGLPESPLRVKGHGSSSNCLENVWVAARRDDDIVLYLHHRYCIALAPQVKRATCTEASGE